MRLTIEMLKVEGQNPPYDHNYLLASTFLSAVRNRSKEASEILHSNPQTSPYVLSEIHPMPGKKGEFYFCFSTTHERLCEIVQESFPDDSNIRVGSTNFKVMNTRKTTLPETISTPIEVATLSPVLVREPKNHEKCLIPDDKGYLDALNSLVASKVKKFAGSDETCTILRVVPQAIRKRRIAEGTVLATKGHFFLHGTDKGLRFILEHGLGVSTAMGFGFVVATGGW